MSQDLAAIDRSQIDFDLELREATDVNDVNDLLSAASVTVGWSRTEQRFSGDPATIIAIVSSISTLLLVINKIVHSWKRDVIVDLRKKNCIVQRKLDSRNGTLTIIKMNGDQEQVAQLDSKSLSKVRDLMKRSL